MVQPKKEPGEKRIREWLKTLAPYIAVFFVGGLVIAPPAVYLLGHSSQPSVTSTVTTTQTSSTTITISAPPATVTQGPTVTQTSTLVSTATQTATLTESTTITQTSTVVQPTTVTQTVTSTLTVTQSPPTSVVVRGMINTTTYGTYPTRVIFQSGSGTSFPSDVTGGIYRVQIPNFTQFKVYMNWASQNPANSAGQSFCAEIYVGVGPGTQDVVLDLKC